MHSQAAGGVAHQTPGGFGLWNEPNGSSQLVAKFLAKVFLAVFFVKGFLEGLAGTKRFGVLSFSQSLEMQAAHTWWVFHTPAHIKHPSIPMVGQQEYRTPLWCQDFAWE